MKTDMLKLYFKRIVFFLIGLVVIFIFLYLLSKFFFNGSEEALWRGFGTALAIYTYFYWVVKKGIY